jgi:hypothetical protein
VRGGSEYFGSLPPGLGVSVGISLFHNAFAPLRTRECMDNDDVEEALRTQFTEAFQGAEFPVDSQMDLVPALPDGPATTFEAGDVSFSAMELAAKLGGHQEFPYANVDELVDDIVAGLHAEGML